MLACTTVTNLFSTEIWSRQSIKSESFLIAQVALEIICKAKNMKWLFNGNKTTDFVTPVLVCYQPRPQGFSLKKCPSHILRKKPWGRGWFVILLWKKGETLAKKVVTLFLPEKLFRICWFRSSLHRKGRTRRALWIQKLNGFFFCRRSWAEKNML